MEYQPIVCSLPTGDAARQALEWHDLADRAVAIDHHGDGVSMAFDIALAEAVEDLARREATCCASLTTETVRTPEHVRVTIRSDDPAAQPVIRVLTGLVSG